MEHPVRIFVSSPGDVAEERALAERVIARLAREWAHSLSVTSFLWEHEPLRATATYQDEIGTLCPPSEADVVSWRVSPIVTVTMAPTTTAPEGSVTTPESAAGCWPRANRSRSTIIYQGSQ